MSPIFQVYCCARSSDRGRLDTDLLSSPEIKNGKVGLTILWNQASAGAAYSRAIKTATAKVLVFAHCDVYFPQGWFERLEWELDRLSRIDSEWAVAGVGSITPSGEIVGRIFDTSLEPVFRQSLGVFGKPLTTPVRIASADELVIIVRRASGVSFDPLLPEFHFYGTDIVLTAEKQGKHCYGLDMPLIHNAKAQLQLGNDYCRAFRYMVRKWCDRLPVQTTTILLTNKPFTLLRARIGTRYKALCAPSTYCNRRLSDPCAKATELGFPDLLVAPMRRTPLH